MLTDKEIDQWLDSLPEEERSSAEFALSRFECPYYKGTGTCSNGCWTEPSCHVDGGYWELELWELGYPGIQKSDLNIDAEM